MMGVTELLEVAGSGSVVGPVVGTGLSGLGREAAGWGGWSVGGVALMAASDDKDEDEAYFEGDDEVDDDEDEFDDFDEFEDEDEDDFEDDSDDDDDDDL